MKTDGISHYDLLVKENNDPVNDSGQFKSIWANGMVGDLLMLWNSTKTKPCLKSVSERVILRVRAV